MHKLSFHLYEKVYKDKMQHKVTSKGVLHNQPLKKYLYVLEFTTWTVQRFAKEN